MANVITANVAVIDNCPIWTRLKAFIVRQGTTATIEHVMRDGQGKPIDLSSYLLKEGSESQSGSPTGSAVLLVKECIAKGPNPIVNPLWSIPVFSSDPAGGVLQAALPASLVEISGIYALSWGIEDGDANIVLNDNSYLMVERSQFAKTLIVRQADMGPPTLPEIKMALMDSGPGDNLLLDRIEFDDEQVVFALIKPIEYYNQVPPPLRPYETTRTFAHRDAWLKACCASLFMSAAHNYRRNRLAYQAGGLTIDDKNKEREYLQAAQLLNTEWQTFVQAKKIEINIKAFHGNVGSVYSRGW